MVLRDLKLEEIEEGIFSSLSPDKRESDYDSKVRAYDLVVGNAIYNRIVWGNWPSNYADFCRQALTIVPGDFFLDAGCGSLVFTAHKYARADKKLIVLLDRSLGMLLKGKERVMKLCGGIPKNIAFIQGDIFTLPFRDACFDTVASFGVLHIFEEQLRLLTELERVKKDTGHLFFSSLVGNNTVGSKYLKVLRNAGEIAVCHSSDSLNSLLLSSPFRYSVTTIGNMAYVSSA